MRSLGDILLSYIGIIKWPSLALLVCLATSCSPVLHSAKITSLTTDYCAPSVHYEDTELTTMQSGDDSAIASLLSKHDLILSRDIGIQHLLSRYIAAKDTLQLLLVKQKISDRLILVQTELEAIASELDCNGERIDQLAHFLDDKNAKTSRRLNVASMIVVAVTTVAAVATKNEGLGTAIGVTGGLVSTGLIAFTINPPGKSVEMGINRSLLKNVWEIDNSDRAFPSSIWKILNEKTFSNSGTQSLIESIKNRWINYVFDGKRDKEDTERFFHKGGRFRADDLHTMANMYNELQATIRSIQQDMRSLTLKINTLRN